jgi:hypothetical protein
MGCEVLDAGGGFVIKTVQGATVKGQVSSASHCQNIGRLPCLHGIDLIGLRVGLQSGVVHRECRHLVLQSS